jgi:tRNA (guanine26-N2/guanine27-N2)-dimethyltransferase
MKLFLREIKEGRTRLLVPDLVKYKRMEDAPIFYNPVMAADRDVSIAILKTFFGRRKTEVADVFSSLGARAVRYANECRYSVTANDIQPSAIKLVKRNARLNKVKVRTSVSETNQFLAGRKYEKFDCIDIDPFGSPANFLNSAMLAIHPKDSMLCVTATDIGVLCGGYPKAAFRKYFITTGMTSFMHELGVRNLIAAVFKEAAKYSYSIRPKLAYAGDHYYRAFLEIVSGRKTTNRQINGLGYLSYCPACERRVVTGVLETPVAKCECGHKTLVLGPTWIERLGDSEFLEKVRGSSFASRYAAEADLPDFYYDIHRFAKVYKKETPRMSEAIVKLAEKGYRVSRTHFTPYGIKTNAPFEEVKALL